MKAQPRAVRGWLAMIAADPWRKLVSIGLGITLWFFLDSQITRSLTVPMPLVAIGRLETAQLPFIRRLAVELPTDRVVGRTFADSSHPETAITQVDVTLTGPRYLIDKLEDQRLDLRVSRFGDTDWSTRTSVEFTAADIDRGQRLLQDSDIRINLHPSSVRLNVERIDSRSMPLTLEVVEMLQLEPTLQSRLRPDTARFSPPAARILGPASSLAALDQLGSKPFRARMSNPGSSKETTAVLELAAPAELGLRLAETPSLTIGLMAVTRVFEVELPIQVDDAALPANLRGQYLPEKNTALVRIRAGGALMTNLAFRESEGKLADFAAEYLRLDVFVERQAPGAILGDELSRVARLALRGALLDTVEAIDYQLDQPLLVRLLKKP